jgi:PAS domain S-box-containing protein
MRDCERLGHGVHEPRDRERLGLSRRGVLGLEPIRTFASVIHADDRDGVEEEVERAVERREPFALDYRIIHADGEIRWVHERGRGIFGPDGAVAYLDGAIFDTTKRKRLEEQLEHLAYHDPLTGLPNRAMSDGRVFGDARRHPAGRPLE